MSKKVLMTESEIRNIIIEEIGYDNYLQLEMKSDWSLGSIAKGIGRTFSTAKKYWKKKIADKTADLGMFPVDDKKLGAVDPNFRPIIEKIMSMLKSRGFDPMIGSAYRSPQSQQKKIEQGRSKTKTIYGYHVALDKDGNKAARAVDLVDRSVGWGGKTQEGKRKAHEFFQELGKIANSPEFKSKVQWGGNWTPKKKTYGGKEFFMGWDPAHIQTRAMTMAQSGKITRQGMAALASSGKSMPDK